jgi:hypothetical protein
MLIDAMIVYVEAERIWKAVLSRLLPGGSERSNEKS